MVSLCGGLALVSSVVLVVLVVVVNAGVRIDNGIFDDVDFLKFWRVKDFCGGWCWYNSNGILVHF